TNLVTIVVDAHDRATSHLRDVSHRASDATADIEDSHAGLQSKPLRESSLMSQDRVAERFTFYLLGKVKRLSPAIFVEVCCEIEITVHHFGVCSLTIGNGAGVMRKIISDALIYTAVHGCLPKQLLDVEICLTHLCRRSQSQRNQIAHDRHPDRRL